jgi:serine/threonine-protein kinase
MNSMGVGTSGPVATGSDDRRLATIVAIAELRHPHLVVMNIADDGSGFEPDLSGGRVLTELQRAEGGSLPLSISLRILVDAMSGLAALHHARADGSPLDFIHGEFTPANIIVGRDGVGRLVPLVKAHWSPGEPSPPEATAHSAPEKLLGDEFNQRADVFSAGVLLWEAMMGRPLFEGLAVDGIVTMLVGGKVVRPSVAGGAAWGDELADVVMRALAVDPMDRWEHVGMMGADIETIAEGQMARSSDVASLVTGRQVSRDSLSDDVTRPLASVIPSLSPFANSIPASIAGQNGTEGLHPRRVGSTVPVVSTNTEPGVLLTSMTARRRWTIVGGALSFSLLLLLVAALRGSGRESTSTSSATVLAPAPMATVEPSPPSPVPSAPAAAADLEPPVPSASAVAARPTPPPQEAKGVRSAAKASASAGRAKPKEDPFGLSHTVRTKPPKEDPFGL